MEVLTQGVDLVSRACPGEGADISHHGAHHRGRTERDGLRLRRDCPAPMCEVDQREGIWAFAAAGEQCVYLAAEQGPER